MLSPSDFNNAVPQFTNGNYASNPINPQYIAEPDAESYNRGTEPLQTLPAQWWNWFLNKFTARFNKVNIYVKNIFNELAQVLSIFNITPDGTEQTPTTSQLKTVFETCYPQYVKTQTTGTAVGCIPTVGTALGTTDNNILVTDSTGKLKPSGITVGTAAGCDAALLARKTEIDALYGNVAGTALGTAAVGTCTTFARSDHVHPDTDIIKGNLKCGYYGIMINGSDGYECEGTHPSSFLRSPYNGFIPYCSAENGVGSIGTEGWPFADVYAKNFHGTFDGNATSATSANYATTAGNADTVDNFHATGDYPYSLFRAIRQADSGAAGYGYWGGMASLNVDGEGKWWHILSMDWSGSDADPTLWVSQFLLPTQQGGTPKYRFNANDGQTAISASPWKNFITEDNIGAQSVNYATTAGSATNASALVAYGGADCEYFTSLSFSNVVVRQCSSSFTIVQRDSNVVALQCDLWKAFTRVASTGSDMSGPRPISTFGQIRFGTCYATNSYENVQCIYPSGGSWIIKTDVNSYTISQNNTAGFAGINIEGRIADTFPWRP